MSGAVNTTLILLLFLLMAVRPPMPRRSSPFNVQFMLGWWINEMPAVGLYWLLAGTGGTLISPRSDPWWWAACGTALADLLLLTRVTVRARSARPALSAAFREAYGPGGEPEFTRPAWWRYALPFVAWRPDVRRIRNLSYGPAGRGNRLDVYVSRRRRPSGAPMLVYVHGGAFVMGTKLLGAHPMLNRLAAQGWVCVSVDYRLVRAGGYANQLDDVRAALAWVRDHAQEYGGDPEQIFAAGGSSGAHLVSTAALSGSPVRGVVAMYGYYGPVGGGGSAPTSPHDRVTRDAPAFLLVHGLIDTLVLPRDARAFAERLRAVSQQPVVYAELPGAQHNFDHFSSLRFHFVTDAVVRFAELATENA